MNKEELLLLIKAGYTKAEIEAMTRPAADPPTEPLEPESGPEPTDQPEPPQPTEFEELKNQFTEFTTEIRNLVKSIQSANVAGARQGEPTRDTVDDILKNILDPKGGN